MKQSYNQTGVIRTSGPLFPCGPSGPWGPETPYYVTKEVKSYPLPINKGQSQTEKK